MQYCLHCFSWKYMFTYLITYLLTYNHATSTNKNHFYRVETTFVLCSPVHLNPAVGVLILVAVDGVGQHYTTQNHQVTRHIIHFIITCK